MAIKDAQQEQLNSLLVNDFDMHGRRITNLSKSVEKLDAVTREELDELSAKVDKILAFLSAP